MEILRSRNVIHPRNILVAEADLHAQSSRNVANQLWRESRRVRRANRIFCSIRENRIRGITQNFLHPKPPGWTHGTAKRDSPPAQINSIPKFPNRLEQTYTKGPIQFLNTFLE